MAKIDTVMHLSGCNCASDDMNDGYKMPILKQEDTQCLIDERQATLIAIYKFPHSDVSSELACTHMRVLSSAAIWKVSIRRCTSPLESLPKHKKSPKVLVRY